MIEKYVTKLALQMGMMLTHVEFVKKTHIGVSSGARLLKMSVRLQSVKVIISQADFLTLEEGNVNEHLEESVKSALARLQMKLQP